MGNRGRTNTILSFNIRSLLLDLLDLILQHIQVVLRMVVVLRVRQRGRLGDVGGCAGDIAGFRVRSWRVCRVGEDAFTGS